MSVRRALVAVVLTALAAARPTAQLGSWPVPDEVAASAEGAGATTAERREISRFYSLRGGPAWTGADGTISADGVRLVALLRAADAHGLVPGDYLTPAVASRVEAPEVSPAARVARDAALTLAALRYARHLHLGRLDPRRLGARLPTWDEPHDFPQLVARAAATGRVAEGLAGLAPPWPVYRGLVDQLARYRAMSEAPLPDLPQPPASVKPGQHWSGLPAARRRLVAFGDLEAGRGTGDTYDADTVAAVARFQARHGLTADGVLGRRTIATLQVTPAARATQIALALERLRWVPDLGTRRAVAVNIPMFQLAAWDAGRLGGPPSLTMKVIVGEAVKTETPVFAATLSHVIFRPYWNVPPSIVRKEVLPALRRDAGYLERQRMELVAGPGDDAPVVAADADGLAALATGAVRLRQRPGPHNSLGLVKFLFPNDDSVYMHGTPAPALFAHDRRDFSHGCIRVEDPARLAAWVLDGVAGWTAPRIRQAMDGAANTRVDVAAPIDVVLFYLTAAVDPVDGALRFADDIYGHDAALARALAAARPR